MKIIENPIEAKVKRECKSKYSCDGKFYEIKDVNGEAEIVNCRCFEKLKKFIKYENARIPDEWWNFDIWDVEKEFDKKILKRVQLFIEKVDWCIINKVQFFFTGSAGTGKTLMSTLMLKAVIDNGYRGMNLNAYEVIDYLYSGRKNELDRQDMLVIDELDKLRTDRIPDFSNLVSSYMDTKTMIFLSNAPIAFLRKTIGFPQFFIDRLNFATHIKFPDVNYRKNADKKFETLEKMIEAK